MYRPSVTPSRSSGTLVGIEAKQLPVVYPVRRSSPRTTYTTASSAKGPGTAGKGYVTDYDTVSSFASTLHPSPATLASSSRFPTTSNLHRSKEPSPIRSPTSPMSANAVSGMSFSPSVGPYGSYGGATSSIGAPGPSGYRYASVDRLTQRSKIYDSGLTPVGTQPGAIASLSTSAIDLHNHLAAVSDQDFVKGV